LWFSKMDWLFNLIGLASALLLIATAFMYLFNPRMGLEWLKKGGIALLLLLLVPALAVELVHASDPIALFVSLALVSITSYVVREWRLARRRRPAPRPRGAERKPVRPREEEEQ